MYVTAIIECIVIRCRMSQTHLITKHKPVFNPLPKLLCLMHELAKKPDSEVISIWNKTILFSCIHNGLINFVTCMVCRKVHCLFAIIGQSSKVDLYTKFHLPNQWIGFLSERALANNDLQALWASSAWVFPAHGIYIHLIICINMHLDCVISASWIRTDSNLMLMAVLGNNFFQC